MRTRTFGCLAAVALLALSLRAPAQANIPPALADENRAEPVPPDWCESEHVRQFYRLARF